MSADQLSDHSARAKHDAICTARRHTERFMFVCTCGLTDREVAAVLVGKGPQTARSALPDAQRYANTPAGDMAREIDRLRAENDRLREALRRIARLTDVSLASDEQEAPRG